MFGLVQLRMKIEGVEDNNPEIKLIAISKKEALNIKDSIFIKYLVADQEEIHLSNILRLSKSSLLISALTSNNLLPTFVAIVVVYYNFDLQLKPKDWYSNF